MKKSIFGSIAGARRRADLPAIYTTWLNLAIANGGTFGANSKAWALDLCNQLLAASYYSKLKYLLPLLGSNLATARVPLIDTIGAGIATNNGFVSGDFSEATGLQDNGAKTLDTLIKPSQLGSSGNGGLGCGIRTFGTGTWTMGSRDAAVSEIYGIAIYSGELAYWGQVSGSFSSGSAGGAKRYGLERASATDRKLYANGIQIGSSTAAALTLGIATGNIFVGGLDASFTCDHQFSYAYMDDGTMSGADFSAFDTLIVNYLLTPTGR